MTIIGQRKKHYKIFRMINKKRFAVVGKENGYTEKR